MVPERERTARQTPDTREIVRPRSRPSLAGRHGLLECAIDDRLGGDQCPTIGVEFVGKGEFLRGEAVLQLARSSGQAPLIIAALQAITVDGSMEATRLKA